MSKKSLTTTNWKKEFDKNEIPFKSNQSPCIVQQMFDYEISKLAFPSLLIAAKLQFWDTRTVATWELVTFCLDEIKGIGLASFFWCVVIVNLRNLQVWRSRSNWQKRGLAYFRVTLKDVKTKSKVIALQRRFLSVEISVIQHVIMSWLQGGISCAGARGSPAEKFGLGRKF